MDVKIREVVRWEGKGERIRRGWWFEVNEVKVLISKGRGEYYFNCYWVLGIGIKN